MDVFPFSLQFLRHNLFIMSILDIGLSRCHAQDPKNSPQKSQYITQEHIWANGGQYFDL